MSAVGHFRRTRKKRAVAEQRKRHFPIWPFAVLLVMLLGGVGVAGGAAVVSVNKYKQYTADLTNPADKVNQDQGPAILYDRNGNELYEFEDKDTGLREPVPLDQISPWLVKATIATEDPDFYTNNGVNQRGLVRAACEYVHLCSSASTLNTGGSGITQQLVKLLFEPPDVASQRTVDRKLKEAAMAVELTKRYNKDQILEWYLNTIFYANRANGIGAAAQIYFEHPDHTPYKASELDLAQSALLAGIPASPGDYDPIAHYDQAKARQLEILDLMVKHGQATQAEVDAAAAEPLNVKEQSTYIREPHWVNYMTDYIKNHCSELLSDCKNPNDALYRDGLRITTTLDSDLTDQATAIVDKRISDMEAQKCDCHNGAAMVIDNNTGQILAMVGSRDYYRQDINGQNNNTLAEYQPGSSLKPIVYLTAFLKGWSPGTIVNDSPHCYPNPPDPKPFCPSGPTNSFNGPIPVRTALGSSINSAAVQTADFDTVQGVLDTAHKMGINTMPDASQYGVSIATGGSSVTLFDMTYMYSTLANNGEMRGLKLSDPKPGYRQVDPVAVLKITDRNNNVMYEFKGPDRFQAEDPRYVYEITDVISDDTAKRLIYSPHLFDLRDGRPIAAKTGTQQGETLAGVRATWNFGYVPDITVGVWVGNSDGSFVNPNLLSATSSLYVWKDIMQAAVDKYEIPSKKFVVPPGLARGLPIPAGSRLAGCGLSPDLYVVGQPVSGPPVAPGQSCTLQGTPGPGVAQPAAPVAPAAPRAPVGAPAEGSSLPGQPATPQAPALDQPAPAVPPGPPGQPARPPIGQATEPPPAPAAPQAPAAPAPAPAPATQAPLRCPPGLVVPTPLRAQICGN